MTELFSLSCMLFPFLISHPEITENAPQKFSAGKTAPRQMVNLNKPLASLMLKRTILQAPRNFTGTDGRSGWLNPAFPADFSLKVDGKLHSGASF